MTIRSRVFTVLLVAAGVVGALMILGPNAFADHKVCKPVGQVVICRVVRDPPPGHGHGGGGGDGMCHYDGETFPCAGPDGTYWNYAHECYAFVLKPQPPLSNPVWRGHTTGAIYGCTPLTAGGIWWSPQGPPGPPPAIVLAQRAASMLHIPTMTVESNGGPSHTTYVGLPTWLWLDGAQWHALTSPPAAVAGESVTATATPISVSWSMGDGRSTACNGPGAPYSAADPTHPPCGYTYRVDSSRQPQTGPSANDRYFTVRATVTWTITWQCVGAACDQGNGALPDVDINTRPQPLRVFQVETVTTDGH